MIYALQILNIIITGVITFIFSKKLNQQSQRFNSNLEKFKFQNSNIQLNALKHIELITTSRIQWIQELREDISILLANLDMLIIEISYVYRISRSTDKNISDLLKSLDIFYFINKISLQLNEKDYKIDKKLIDSLEELESKIKELFKSSFPINSVIIQKNLIDEIKKLKTEIKEKSREILKTEWERVKEEIPETINK